MRKPLYDAPPAPPTPEKIRSSRRVLILLGLAFIAAGVWDISNGYTIGTSRRLAVFANAFGAKNVATVFDAFCILLGAFLLFVSRMKPYSERHAKH